MSSRYLFVVVAGMLVAAGPKDDPSLTLTCPKLHGTWQLLEFREDNGRIIAIDNLSPDQFNLRINEQGFCLFRPGREYYHSPYWTDDSTDPLRIDFGDWQPGKMFSGKGIYNVDKDTLRICTARGRPDSFQRGEGRTLLLFKRVKL